jgi:hypothetical protein
MKVPQLTRIQWKYLEALRLKPADRLWSEPEVGLIRQEFARVQDGKVTLSDLGLQALGARRALRAERLDAARNRKRSKLKG